jgi:hypothetical protein
VNALVAHHRPFRRFISIAKIEAMTRAMPAA